MSSAKPNNSQYPEVPTSNPEAVPAFSSSSSSLYPPVDSMNDIADSLFPEPDTILRAPPSQELLITIPGVILHLIEPSNSVELACGELNVVALRQDNNVVAVLARIGNDIQWPLAKDEPVVKLDQTHYFFTLHVPANTGAIEDDGEAEENEKEKVLDEVVAVSNHEGFEVLNYGLTVAAKGQEGLLMELDKILDSYSCFSVQNVKEMENWEMVAKAVSPEELQKSEKTKDLVAENSAAYWTTLAPNVEDYSGKVARMIAAGSGQLIRGILWCGDLTVDRLKWGHEFMKRRLGSGSESKISPACMRRMQRVKKMTKMSEKLASGVLSGVVKVSGFFTSSIVNSTVGKKFFSLLPGEIVLASLDGFSKVCDAVEVAGRNVMSTTSTVTTGLVSQRYGEQAARATTEGLDAAGHAIGTAWAVFKIRKALNPKSVLKPTTLVKTAAEANSAGLKSKSDKNGS